MKRLDGEGTVRHCPLVHMAGSPHGSVLLIAGTVGAGKTAVEREIGEFSV